MFLGVLSAEAQPPLDGAFRDHSDAPQSVAGVPVPVGPPPVRPVGPRAARPGRSDGPRRVGWRVGPDGLLGEGKTGPYRDPYFGGRVRGSPSLSRPTDHWIEATG